MPLTFTHFIIVFCVTAQIAGNAAHTDPSLGPTRSACRLSGVCEEGRYGWQLSWWQQGTLLGLPYPATSSSCPSPPPPPPTHTHKVRKLEFLLADAISKGCDSVITCGSIQSNHCRATAVAAAELGFKSHLFLRWHGEMVSVRVGVGWGRVGAGWG